MRRRIGLRQLLFQIDWQNSCANITLLSLNLIMTGILDPAFAKEKPNFFIGIPYTVAVQMIKLLPDA